MGRSDGERFLHPKNRYCSQMTDTCRNRIAALILDDLYTVDELANMSLSGRKCPGQDREAKPKLPQNIITAIHSRPIIEE
jgi:hypothetical protein